MDRRERKGGAGSLIPPYVLDVQCVPGTGHYHLQALGWRGQVPSLPFHLNIQELGK